MMLEKRRFKVPQLEGDGQLMNKLAYDMTADVQFEFMRNQARYAALYRRHVDLQKACEKKIQAYERRERAFSSEVNKYKQKVQQRLSTLLVITTANLNQRYGHDWRSQPNAKLETNPRKIKSSKPEIKPREKTQISIDAIGTDTNVKQVKSEDEPRLAYLPAPRDMSYSEGKDVFISKYEHLRDREFLTPHRRTRPNRLDSLTVNREKTM